MATKKANIAANGAYADPHAGHNDVTNRVPEFADKGRKYAKTEVETEAKSKKDKPETLQITPPKMDRLTLRLIGTAPLVQHRFGQKAKQMIQATQEAGSLSKKGKKREPKDFQQNFMDARHIAIEGWDGIHAGGFRRALVDSCRLVGFAMTRAKLALFIIADGFSAEGTPLVKITKGQPRQVVHEARNSSGVIDLRSRPMWDAGWEVILTIEYDAEMFSAGDVANLVMRVGVQCGIGEGRPNSKDSCGCGWGTFRIASEQDAE